MSKNLCTKIKNKVTQFDLFSHSQFLRYREQSQYKSFNGGLCSIVIIIGFIILFILKFIQVNSKTDVISITTMLQSKEPPALTINTSELFFAVGVSYGFQIKQTRVNLNDPNITYYNFNFYSTVTVKITNQSNWLFSLIPCSRQAWVAAHPDIGDTFDRLQLQKWLCIPPNMTLTFIGNSISQIFKYSWIELTSCSQSNLKCQYNNFTNDLQKNGLQTRLNTYFINTIINPNDQNYLDTYLDDKNYFYFTNTTASIGHILFSTYDIQSDVSLLPTIDIVQDSGFMAYEPTRSRMHQIINTNYLVRLFLRKSSLQIHVVRSFQKYLDFFSYIGGLFGALMSAFFIMHFFHESAFQIEVASLLYKQTKDEKIKSKYFNILTYFVQLFYSLVHYFGANPEWKLFKQFNNVSQQISKQLDINLLLKKIRFLQDCMGYIFQDFQLKCLYLKDKHTLDQAAKDRRKYSSRSYLLKLKKKRMKQEQNNKNALNQKMDPPKPFYELNSLEQMMEKRRVKLTTSKEYMDETPHPLEQKKEYSKSINIQQQKEQPRERQIMTRLQEIPNDSYRYQQAHIAEDQSSQELSSLDETEQKQLYQNVLDSINALKNEASKGKPRCVEIFNSLDEVVKQVAGIPKQQIKTDFSLIKSQNRLQKLFD